MKILSKGSYSFRLPIQNPFILTAHHLDLFPEGNGRLGPRTRKGLDSEWRMYYGQNTPGFPVHPHRGFETVTIVTRGTVDHTDGLGSSGRYSNGDVQWMTAGAGLQHCEMFPLLNTDHSNTMELFQIWLNLPAKSKMVEPAYKMLWSEQIPTVVTGEKGHQAYVTVIAGSYQGKQPPSPAKDSWAVDPNNHVSIQLIELEPGATYSFQGVSETMGRSLYCYQGDGIDLQGAIMHADEYAYLDGNESGTIQNIGKENAKLLLLEGEPINEPVQAQGPFVMNTYEEIIQAYSDYRATEFSGWPFDSDEPIHGDMGRYAKHADGTVETP